MVYGPWALVLGSGLRQGSPGTSGQVSCSEMLGFLSSDGVTKWPCPSQMVLFGKTH